MTLPTATIVTNRYLLGQSATPNNFVDDKWIRAKEVVDRFGIDALDYMQGPGRFALPAMSSLVKKFFGANWTDSASSPFTAGIEYTKQQAAALLGVSDYGITFQQYSYNDGSADYGERIYVWGSTAFKLSDDIKFVVDDTGRRYIKNMSVVPRYYEGSTETTDDKKENFDFKSSNPPTFLANGLLEAKVDPSAGNFSAGIGRTVIFNIIGYDRIPSKVGDYDFASYQADLAKEKACYQGGVASNRANIYAAVENVWAGLWNNGVTRFIDGDGRAIIYGSSVADRLSVSNVPNYALPDFRNAAFTKGLALIGGSGEDFLVGGQNGDYLDGGADNDILQGDLIVGGSSSDIYVFDSNDGKDTIIDLDRKGSVRVAGATITGSTTDSQFDTQKHRVWKDSNNLEYVQIGRDLLIRGGTLGSGEITVKNFDFKNGALGITLKQTSKIGVGVLGDASPFNEAGSGDQPHSPISVLENLAQGLKVFLNGQAKAGDTITLALSALGDKFKAVLGDEIVGFDSGEVTLTLAEGQTEVALGFLSTGDVDADQALTLTATLQPADGGEAVNNTLTINFDAVDEAAAAETTTTITGDIKPTDMDTGKEGIQAVADMYGNPIGTNTSYGDILYGTAGNDHILSGDLNDDVYADFGDDWIEGGNGNDQVFGMAGNDLIEGGTASDLLVGGFGNDRLFANVKMETATAIANGATDIGSGQKGDWLAGNEGDDILVGSIDNDVLAGGAGSDLLIAGAGDDDILGDADYVAQSMWDDKELFQMGGGRWWYHTSAATHEWTVTDQPDGARFFFPVYGEAKPAGAAGDMIYAGMGNDNVWAGEGGDNVFGEGGNDRLFGDGGDDVLLGGDGDDTLNGDNGTGYIDGTLHGNDFLDGGEGNDTLLGAGRDDVLYGGAGNDTLSGDTGDEFDGDDYLDGEDGDDVMAGGGGEDILYGGAGNDQLYGENGNTPESLAGDDYIDGEDGDDLINGVGGADVLYGGAGSDQIYGDAQDTSPDKLGDDYLDGEDGDDVLDGAGGSDTLYGGEGNDQLYGDDSATPIANRGDDFLDGEAGNDILVGAGGSDTLYGGEGDDSLYGDSGDTQEAPGDDFLDGGAGNDLLVGGGGSDTLYGGEGDGADILVGESGNDAIFGQAGNDELQGGDGDDVLDGGLGNDTLFGEAGNDVINGGDGNDFLIGGAGNDLLDGGNGNDIYYFGSGGGNDRISDSGGTDWLVLTGVTWGQLNLGVGSLKLTLPDGSELHLDDFDPEHPLDGAIEYFQFGDGAVLTRQQLIQNLGFKIEGTPGDDELSGTALGDTIRAYEGNDSIYALGGNNSIDAGSGDDLVVTGDGADTVNAGDGADTLYAGGGGDVVLAGSGDDILYGEAGNDALQGNGGNDTLAGGAGNDTLVGGDGDDSYVFGRGDGQDVANDSSGANQVILNGLVADGVALSRQGTDLIVAVVGTTDRLTVQGWFADSASWQRIVTGDGQFLDRAAVDGRLIANRMPVVTNDYVALSEDGVLVASGNAIANDFDPEGRSLTVTDAGNRQGAYGSLTLASSGNFTYNLNNTLAQSLGAGQQVSETFTYTVSDSDPAGAQTATGQIVATISGRNDAPVVGADSAQVAEDGIQQASGNVLGNDRDVDTGDTLSVLEVGTHQGTYGTLSLMADGRYSYLLDNAGTAIQELGRNDVVSDTFVYTGSDGLAGSAGQLVVRVSGANDAPILVAPLADQQASPNASWTWQIPATSFQDPDRTDTLSWHAALGDGGALPSWLAFDAASQTFSGRVPRDATGYLDIEVTVTDGAGASSVAAAGDLSATDVFRLSFDGTTHGGGGGNTGGGHGNQGVGNGEDPPPPGHDIDFNDGSGTGPGNPGAQGGYVHQPMKRDVGAAPVNIAGVSVPGIQLNESASHGVGTEHRGRPGPATDRALSNPDSPAQSTDSGSDGSGGSNWHAMASGSDDSAAGGDTSKATEGLDQWFDTNEARSLGLPDFSSYLGNPRHVPWSENRVVEDEVAARWQSVFRQLAESLDAPSAEWFQDSPVFNSGLGWGAHSANPAMMRSGADLSLLPAGQSLKVFQGLNEGMERIA